MAAKRVLTVARRSPWGLAVRRGRRDPTVATVEAALSLHTALLRERRDAAWRAIDAVERLGSQTAAAAALGCSPQAVSKQVRQSHRAATARTATLLAALLERPDPDD